MPVRRRRGHGLVELLVALGLTVVVSLVATALIIRAGRQEAAVTAPEAVAAGLVLDAMERDVRRASGFVRRGAADRPGGRPVLALAMPSGEAVTWWLRDGQAWREVRGAAGRPPEARRVATGVHGLLALQHRDIAVDISVSLSDGTRRGRLVVMRAAGCTDGGGDS